MITVISPLGYFIIIAVIIVVTIVCVMFVIHWQRSLEDPNYNYDFKKYLTTTWSKLVNKILGKKDSRD